jgi:glycine cleavage system H lipoate-binding protein
VRRAGFDGTVVAPNENLVDKPELLTRDPFGDGCMLIVRPAADNWQTGLVTGAASGPTIERWIAGGAYRERID